MSRLAGRSWCFPSILGLTLSGLTGCGEPGPTTPPPPPPICNTPSGEGPRFTEVTDQMGLAAIGALGTSVRAGDLDGDGYADLITSVAHLATRETPDKRMRFVLLNRPDPIEPSRRIFVDFTAESGLLATRDGAGGRGFGPAALGDLDDDGDLDVVVCAGSDAAGVVDACAAFLNDGAAHFALAPMNALEWTGIFACHSLALLDLDRDGALDVWPGAFGSRPYVFRGGGDGTFTEVTDEVGLPGSTPDPETGFNYRTNFGVTACDLDLDGDDDLLVANYGRAPNQVWLNEGGRFTEHGVELGLAYDDRMSYDDDQNYLCFCVANPSRCPVDVPAPISGACPSLRGWRPGIDDQPPRLGGVTFSLTCGDIDDDGDMDVMSAEIRHGDVGSASDPSELILNVSPPGGPLGKFSRPGNLLTGLERVESGIYWNQGDMMPVFADLDLDGRKDIYLTSSDYPTNHGWLWRQKSDGSFEDVSDSSGAGQKQIHGVALVDLDHDGDLDLVAGTSTARSVAPTNAVRVYRNEAYGANWTRIRLVGSGLGGANRSAIGAVVRVKAGGRTQLQEVQAGFGHNSMQHDLVLTFGLGAACAVEEVEVRWPDAAGTVSRYTDLRANYLLELRQGSPEVTYP